MHKTQAAVYKDQTRFRVVVCGRRWGKSFEGQIEAVTTAYQGGVVWWIAPTYGQATLLWDELLTVVRKIPGTQVRVADRLVRFGSDGVLMLKSADHPDTLRGAGLDLAILDECPLMKRDVWVSVIRPALAEKQGRALFLFTPRGMGNWTYELYGWGLDPELPDWSSVNLPTSTNPFVPASEIEQMRSEMPDRQFREEVLAEFIADGEGVFRGILQACIAEPQDKRLPGHQYIMSIDWGRTNDFTAISIMDTTDRREVQLDRFTGMMYQHQQQRIKTLYEKWQPKEVWAEANSIGGPNIEALQQDGIPVQPFQTTNSTKADAVNALTLAIERTAQGLDNGIVLLADEVGISELQAFEYDTSPSGLIRFGARSGSHDDTVIARAIAVKQMGEEGKKSITYWPYNPFRVAPDSPAARERMAAFNKRVQRRKLYEFHATSNPIQAEHIGAIIEWPDGWHYIEISVDIHFEKWVISPSRLPFTRGETGTKVHCLSCYRPVGELYIDGKYLRCEACKS